MNFNRMDVEHQYELLKQRRDAMVRERQIEKWVEQRGKRGRFILPFNRRQPNGTGVAPAAQDTIKSDRTARSGNLGGTQPTSL